MALLGAIILLPQAGAIASAAPTGDSVVVDSAEPQEQCDPDIQEGCVCNIYGKCWLVKKAPKDPGGPRPVEPEFPPIIDPVEPGPGPGPAPEPPPGDWERRYMLCLGLGLQPGTPEFDECMYPPAPPDPDEPPPVPPPTEGEIIELIVELQLPTPQIGSAPCSDTGCMGAVGLPVWLWTQPWETYTDSVTIRGYTLSLTATPVRATWSMGDGTTLSCMTSGTPYDTAFGIVESPDCGHVYQTTSSGQPDQAFLLTADLTYLVEWSGVVSGSIEHTMSSMTPIRVGEYQSVVEYSG